MADGPDPLVQQILNETKPGEDEHKVRVRRYDTAYRTYRPEPVKVRRAYESSTRVPYGMQVIDTAMVNMLTGRPRCKVTARRPEHLPSEQPFQQVFDYYVGKDHLVEKQPGVVQQGLIFGVTGGKNHWLLRKGNRLARDWSNHPLTGETISTVTQNEVIFYDGPSFEPWNVYDMWWDPNGRDVDDCAYVILRSWKSKDQLLADACTVPGPVGSPGHTILECDGMYHSVDALLATGAAAKTTLSAQERLLGGSQSTIRKDLFELWEVWRDNQLTVIGNRNILLRDSPNPHWHGKKPIVIANTRPDLFKVQGIPETELIADLQEALWTITNMRLDSWHLTVAPMLTYREGSIVNINDVEIRPRGLIPVQDHDDLHQLEIHPLPPEAYQEEVNLKGDMQLVSGINPYNSGSGGGGTPGVDQNTATGITLLQQVAGKLLQFKASQIQYRCWQRTFEQWGSDIQQFMDKEQQIRVDGPGGIPGFVNVTPQQVAGDFDFVLDGTEDSLSRQQERSEAVGLLQAFAPLAQLGIVNWKPILEKVGKAYGFENPDELLAPPQQAPTAAPHGVDGQLQQGQAGPQTPPGLPAGNGQGLPQGIMQAIQSGHG